MITVFNRRVLLVTFDIAKYAKIRDALQTNGIDYVVIPHNNGGLGFARNADALCEYVVYVKKKDYEKAKFFLGI